MTEGKTFHAILGAFLLLAAGFGTGGEIQAQTSAQETSPRAAAEFVRTLGREAVLLQSAVRSSGPENRATLLRDLIRRGFNLELTSQFVLGKFWNRATAEQRAEFQELFTEYLLNSYARHIGSYHAETLNIVASHPVGVRDVLVETRVTGDDGESNPIWRVRAQDGNYKIIDVSIDGVSLALTQRREFAAVINRQGLDGLLDILRRKLAAQAKAAQAETAGAETAKGETAKGETAKSETSGGDLIGSLFASILASPNANQIGLLLALR